MSGDRLQPRGLTSLQDLRERHARIYQIGTLGEGTPLQRCCRLQRACAKSNAAVLADVRVSSAGVRCFWVHKVHRGKKREGRKDGRRRWEKKKSKIAKDRHKNTAKTSR